MKPSQAFTLHREAIREVVAASKLENPRLFGSALHGDDIEGSDLDILVDAPSGTSLFDLARLQIALEAQVGIAVDVRTAFELPEKFRSCVLAEALPV